MAGSFLISSVSHNLSILIMVCFLVPLLMVITNVFAMFLEAVYAQSKRPSFFLYQYLGDISYLFPLNVI